ncbi:MAG TPA: DUF4162 domain-containing protein, partial [Verrucomicrobiae bacterium]|nr:DUF4162 domain-containing protein [Verrucomicrobiae bacterium]
RAGRANRVKVELANAAGNEWLAPLRQIPGILAAELTGNLLSVTVQDLATGASRVLGLLQEHRQQVVHFSSEQPNLESVFLELTGRKLRDA